MSLAARISPAELYAQVSDRFAGAYLEARLINAPGTAYLPGTTDDTEFLSFEVASGLGGYTRQVISYTQGDVTNYADDGVGLSTRATVFAHDGVGSVIEFSHVALVWSQGNAVGLDTPVATPTSAVDGTYTNIPIDSSSFDGEGMTVNLTVSNSGSAATDYALTIIKSGSGYVNGESLVIEDGTLAGIGAIQPGAGPLVASVNGTIDQTNFGQILAVAETSAPVQLTAGNEAAFYWNLKQFGFYNVAI